MIEKILTKKHLLLLLLLLIFTSSCFAMEPTINSYLKEGGKEKNATFKDEKAYLAWMEIPSNKTKPKTVIVGSGRGSVSGKEKYAEFAYPGKEYDYLLVNYTENPKGYGKGTQPDIDLDIKKINILKENTYDYCIFENVDFNVSFSKEAIVGAIKILKPDGKLITSNYPMLPAYNSIGKDCISILQLSTGFQLMYNNQKKEINCFLFDSENKKVDRKQEQEFLNGNAQKFIAFFEIQNECKQLEFISVKAPNDLWPSISEIREKIGLKTYMKPVLIFTRKK